MRNLNLLTTLNEKYPEQYEFLKSKIMERDSQSNEKLYFLGFRNENLSLYYHTHRVANIRESDGSIVYEMDPYYLEGLDIKSPLTFDEFKRPEVFSHIISQIEKHVMGKHGKEPGVKREKICQQWIANMNNDNDSEWYFVDLEYVYDQDPYGRPDLIAVKRNRNSNGKFEVALVELKIRNDSYKGIIRKKYAERKTDYEFVKHNLYSRSEEIQGLEFGFGIVGHIIDYLRFLYKPENYSIQMRNEIVQMIQGNVQIGLIDGKSDLANVTAADLEDKPTIYILTYTYVPSLPNDKSKKKPLKSCKRSLFNYIFTGKKCSEFSLLNMLNEKQIDGLIYDKSGFEAAIKDDAVTRIERTQTVNGANYRFIFTFKDPDDSDKEPWNCLC